MIAQFDTIVDSNKKITGKKVIIAIPTNKLKKPTSLEINNDGMYELSDKLYPLLFELKATKI